MNIISNDRAQVSLWTIPPNSYLCHEDAATDGDIRVVDESGEDYLYPAEYFVFVELPRLVEKSLLRAA
jgi:hypothetical protein